MKRFVSPLAALLMGLGLVLVSVGPAEAKATRVEKADRSGGKVLAYVEPYRVKRYKGKRQPTRLYVEFRDGSAWHFTPCKEEDSRNCFWWAPKRGNGKGKSFVDLRGKVIRL